MLDAPFDVLGRVYQAKERRNRIYPSKSNRASELGHDCLRYLVYSRSHWQQKSPPSIETQFIFEAGRRIENEAVDELKEAGFQVLEQGRSFEYRELNITGHLDLKLADGNVKDPAQMRAYPTEVKGLNHYDWNAIDSIDDMRNSNKPWVRKYPAQLMLYLLMDNSELGLFYIKSKQHHRPKIIWCPLDYEYAESLLKKAEQINGHVVASTLPERIVFDEKICGWCDFRHVCLPDQDFGEAAILLDSEDLATKLKRRAELEVGRKEYEALDKEIKLVLDGQEKLIVGDYYISGKWVSRKSYNIPEEIKAQYQGESRYWKTTITPLGEAGK